MTKIIQPNIVVVYAGEKASLKNQILQIGQEWDSLTDAKEWDLHYSEWRPIGLEYDAYAFPGGYPLYYITKDDGILCPACCNKNISRCAGGDDDQFLIVGCEINYEDKCLTCDECSQPIEAAYGE